MSACGGETAPGTEAAVKVPGEASDGAFEYVEAGSLPAGQVEQSTAPPPSSRSRRAPRRQGGRRVLISVLVVVAIFAGLVGWGWAWYSTAASGSPGGSQVILTVKPGESLREVTSALVRDGVVRSDLAFRISLVLDGSPTVRPGGYLFYRHESFAQVHKTLAEGPDVFSVDVLPGYTLREVADAVGNIPGHSAQSFLSLADSGQVNVPYSPATSHNLEGLLAPGIYTVLPGESDLEILEQMVSNFEKSANQLGLAAGAQSLGVTPYQVLIVASIVQKEATSPGDSEAATSYNSPRVARVIYNRLASNTPLQMDSTVLYSLGQDGGPVTPADLEVQSPYNTYLNRGLPPTPICFFSAESLQAALNPAPGNWMWFELVSKDGTESFESTYAQHEADIERAKAAGLP